jgi:DNA polymerase V
VFITTNHFSDEPQYHNAVTLTLPVATNDTSELLAYALCGMEQIFQAGFRYKKAGILV